MKHFVFPFAFVISTLFITCQSQAQKWIGASGSAKVEVIDFHSNHRCVTCLAIEKTAREVVENNFAGEVKAGKIVFKTVNVDDDKNAAVAEKFEAAGTALFVYNGKTGQAYDLTEKAFLYAMNNENKFREEIKSTIRKALLTL